MTTLSTQQIIFAAVNLAFIVTHLYGWLLKWFYKPEAYKERFHELFPAQRAVGTIYLLQILELPYLLQVGDPDALLYVNAFSLLVFSVQMLIMCELYFFPKRRHPLRDYWIAIPAVVAMIPLFLQAVGLVALPGNYRFWTFLVVGVIFCWYFWHNVRMAMRIGAEVRRVNEDIYADTDDFPVRFAQYIQWAPTLVCVLLAINFYMDSPVAKCIRDILFIAASIAFCIYTLNPWRKAIVYETAENSENSENQEINNRLSDDRFEDLARRLDHILTEEHIFTEQHITIDHLVARLGTNSKYITEVIKRSGYSSFYDMVNQHRVRYAISLIHQHPERRLRDVAFDCGFASSASMNRAFASQGKPAPGTFRSSYQA